MSVAWVGAGIAAVGPLSQMDAAGDAADGQAAATGQANALTQKQFNQLREDQAPYREFGKGSVNKLAMLLGLDGAENGSFLGNELVRSVNGVPSMNPELYGTDPNYRAAWDEFTALHQAQYGQGLRSDSDAGAVEAFLRSRGLGAKPAGGGGSTNPEFGSLLKNFTGEDLENEPGYKFGLDEGMRGLNNRFASAGSYFSGAALKGATKYAQDYAGTKFNDAFNRDSANKTRTYNFLSGGASLGQNAAAQTGNAGMQMAQTIGSNTTGLANAQGAAGIAGANAWGNGIGNAVGAYQQNELMNKILNGNTGWGFGNRLASGMSSSTNPAYG